MQSRCEWDNDEKTGSLAGRLLIATPAIKGSCFEHAVIYLCAHNAEGAMGIMVNYPIESVQLKDIFDQMGYETAPAARDFPVHFGGPVDANRGFIVHRGAVQSPGAVIHDSDIVVTGSALLLQSLAKGQGPVQGMLALGYAGWSAGQLESEIETGSWIIAPASPELIFETENEVKWNFAIASMGIDLGHLSPDVGHA